MKSSYSPYYHTGNANDLVGKDRVLYRALEILPGALTWGTLIGVVFLSAFLPVYAAVFIIAFDFYWLLKTTYLSVHLRQNWKRMKHNMEIDWNERLKNLKHNDIVHLVLLPYYKEGREVIEKSLDSILSTATDKKNIAIVLAGEERAGEEYLSLGRAVEEKYKNLFGYFLLSVHPKDIPGEMPGKGSNIAYAAALAKEKILDKNNLDYGKVLVSAFDIDTVVYKDYFSCLTWNFLTAENPYRSSFQPVPVYNNNIWQSPALSRVVAVSGTFWQMIQQERPERLATFSSHAMTFRALYEVGYWQKNMVSEDSRIFWNSLIRYNGDYKVVPISYPVSMDANLAPTFWETIKNIYKQQRRWTWGVENIPYIIFNFIKNKKIPLKKKIKISLVQLEGFWSLTTNPIIIFLLGWLPLVLGGREFNATVLSYNLPIITRNIMILAMAGLVLSAAISLSFLPEAPKEYKKKHRFYMIIQWALIPITITIFSAIPGIDAQTRLMLGKYMGFWVTPKFRKEQGVNQKRERGSGEV